MCVLGEWDLIVRQSFIISQLLDEQSRSVGLLIRGSVFGHSVIGCFSFTHFHSLFLSVSQTVSQTDS